MKADLKEYIIYNVLIVGIMFPVGYLIIFHL